MTVNYARKSADLIEDSVRALEVKIQEEKVKKRERRKTSTDKLAELKQALREHTDEEAVTNV